MQFLLKFDEKNVGIRLENHNIFSNIENIKTFES